MNLPKIGWATFIAAYNSIGIIMHKHSTFQCWGTSKRCRKNTNIAPLKTTTLSFFPVPKTVWRKSTRTAPCQHFPQVITGGNQRNKTCHWQHFILCPCCQHHCAYGPQLHCNQANKGNNKHNWKGQTTPRLFGNKPRRHHAVHWTAWWRHRGSSTRVPSIYFWQETWIFRTLRSWIYLDRQSTKRETSLPGGM